MIFNTALKINDQYIDSYNNLGACLLELEKLDEAKRILNSAYEIDKKLQEDAARPIIANNVRYNCFQPHVKGFKTMTNSLYNGWRFEDIYLDK